MVQGQDEEPTETDRGPPRPLYHPEPIEENYVPGTFQSDMRLTFPQVNDLYVSVSEQMNGTQKRRAVSSTKWLRGIIPYEIDDNFGQEIRTTIQQAMDLWEENTCITFREYTPEVAEELGTEHRVLFEKASAGCVSWVGMINHFPQTISLSEERCNYMGTIAHEIGHAVGWHHEQGRPDRDGYVTVLYDNIKAGFASNFKTYEVETYGVPYDIESIMHYGSEYFSKGSGLLTIEPKNPLDLFKMGNREDFTFYDRKIANVMYECSSECDPLLQCENEGYVGKDCKCYCKPDYSGTYCEIYMQGSDNAECMSELSADEDVKTIMSPGYPTAYDSLMTCAWLIQGPPNTTLSLVFTDFEVEISSRDICFDYVQVRSDSYIYTGGKEFGYAIYISSYCGNEPPPPIVSTGNQILVILYTDSWGERKGFRADYFINPESDVTTLPMASTVVSTTAHTTAQTTGQTTVQTTAQTTAQTTDQTTAITTAQTTAVIMSQTTAQTTAHTTAKTTAATATQITAVPTAQTTVQTSAQTTTQTIAVTTAQTTHQTTPQTSAQTTAKTTVVTTAQTTAQTSAQTAAKTSAQTTFRITASASIPILASTTTVTTHPPTSIKPTAKCEAAEGTCGGQFTGSGCIASPNYGHGVYNNNEECVYHIQVDAGKRVRLTVEHLDIEYEETCTWDRLVVIPGDTLGSLRTCGSELPFGTFVSLDNTMTVKMISDGFVAKGGFAASFQGITVD
ncbi:protein SpAN-like [Patiria miniata]|uniref:Metalloendopeptidase n=1 Tax=Patiria miniata TaxID=46514 RepID=A0A914A9N7_PATMI|nr:protein SpAN-like [Patiria miniata]